MFEGIKKASGGMLGGGYFIEVGFMELRGFNRIIFNEVGFWELHGFNRITRRKKNPIKSV